MRRAIFGVTKEMSYLNSCLSVIVSCCPTTPPLFCGKGYSWSMLVNIIRIKMSNIKNISTASQKMTQVKKVRMIPRTCIFVARDTTGMVREQKLRE